MPELNRLPIIDALLSSDLEFDDLHLEQMAQEDLLQLLQALRGHCLRLTALVGDLSDQIKIIDAFARPATSRKFFYVPGKERIIQ